MIFGESISYCQECGEEIDPEANFCNSCGAPLKSEKSKQTPQKSRRGGKTSMNMEENVEGALTYVFWWITGIVFLLIEEDSEFVRFHAMQSIVTFLPLTILSYMFVFILWPFGSLISLLSLVLWLVLMFKAYQGERFKLPIVGDIAEDLLSSGI